MLRCTIEVIPFGDENRAQKIGIVEIGNDGTGKSDTGNYRVILKKASPWDGVLKEKWLEDIFKGYPEDAEVVAGTVSGYDRSKRGPYDLLYLALKACGLEERNPAAPKKKTVKKEKTERK
jgi:hypothetical protein